ncbi:hypothetical protein D9615_005422 [Tricholomella constricta]|uniref:Pesticidal crystal protein domain-containing protein n=1 Tax=Tricholomella constricta TaxID=117010 RepID=A0A8H5HE47_9AGAR|nr:hypothetical protein D9615_005422 [Tricholomella constricta]
MLDALKYAPLNLNCPPFSNMSRPPVVTDEEIAPILLHWKKVVEDFSAADLDAQQSAAHKSDSDNSASPPVTSSDAALADSKPDEAVELHSRFAPPPSDGETLALVPPGSRGRIQAHSTARSRHLIRATEADVFVYNLVGSTLAVALGFIPGVGAAVAGLFTLLWTIFAPTADTPDPLAGQHDRLVALIREEISLASVEDRLVQGRAFLQGLQFQGDEFKKAYTTWEADKRDPSRQLVLQMEFTSLKNALILFSPVYWDSPGLTLLQLGCTMSTLLVALLRDVVREGREWGFAQRNILDFQGALTSHIDYIVTQGLAIPLSGRRTFASAGDFVYMDPTSNFLGPSREIKFLRTQEESGEVLAADCTYVVSASAMGNVSMEKVAHATPATYSGLSSGEYIRLPRNSGAVVKGTLRFDRDATFHVRMGRSVIGYVTLNGTKMASHISPNPPNFFTNPHTTRTVDRAINFEMKQPAGDYYIGSFFSDVVFTPV